MANTDINPIVIDTTVSDVVEAAYESGYYAGKIVATGKSYWRGVRWGVLACGVGYGVYKILTKTWSDADNDATNRAAAPHKKYRPNWDGMWKTRVEMLQKELDEALEKAEKEL